jgi:hypothetical protein
MQAGKQGHALHPARIRALRQRTADITAVSTPQELVNAVTRVDAHLELRQHLDLTSAALGFGSNSEAWILGFFTGVSAEHQSVQLEHAAGMHVCVSWHACLHCMPLKLQSALPLQVAMFRCRLDDTCACCLHAVLA